MRRCARAVTGQSTVVVILLLIVTLLLLDSYKWRRLPWYSSFSKVTIEGHKHQRGNETLSTIQGDGHSESFHESSPDQGNPKFAPISSEEDDDASVSPPPSNSAPPAAQAESSKPRHVKVPTTSLEKLEYGLHQARYAIRNALIAGANSTQAHSAAQYEPYGDVYRNPATFRESYREMERRFKVFVYLEGEEPLIHNGPCKEIYAIEGRFIQELQGENRFLTRNPEEAHVYFLPFSVAMMVTFLYKPESGNMDSLQHFVQDYVDVVMHKYPYWNQSGGADHFMLSCHDWGPAVTKINSDLETKSIRVLCNANTTEGYVPWKDASLPEINLVGGNIPAQLGGSSAQDRPHLAFFAGHDHGPVRPDLFEHWEGKDEDVKVYRSLPPQFNYHDLMKKSRFCICPGGYEVNSPRIVESIYNECVPVIIADSFVLPFSDVLNWQSFSVHMKEIDIPNLKTILQSIPMEQYRSMQEKVTQVQRHFLLHQPPQRYDAFHMILHSVWLRRLNIHVVAS